MLHKRLYIAAAVLFFTASAALATMPCLLVADTSFVPEHFVPSALRHHVRQAAPSLEIEGLRFAPVREFAASAGLEVGWDSSSSMAVVRSPEGTFHLRALSPLKFWADEAVAAVTDYEPRTEVVRCERIVDGDTIKLDDGRRVRYIGVDTPETKHPRKPVEFFGKQASEYNKSLVSGKYLVLEYDVERTDRYGRTLAYVYRKDTFVNARLAAGGYAQTLTYPPNVRYVSLFRWLQERARTHNRGLWRRANDQATGKFVGSKNSDVYHRPECRWAKEIAPYNRVWFSSAAEARQRGYRPCRACDPPTQ
ncbi:MAG: thermonuclease family protein [Armatimonadota bacterium]